ncbi:MAG: HlyD family efflux transporter periplasmic adaptor subunit [Coprococcus sp.]
MLTIKRKNPKPLHLKISFGFVLFTIIFIYMIIRIAMSVNDHELSIFQVEESSYDTDFTATGIAIRNESFNYSDTSGYVCYYIRDGEKVSKGSNVYSIDETGSMYDALYDVQSNNKDLLTDKEYNDISSQIRMFKAGFSSSSFSDVYDFKYSIDNKVLELYEELALEQLTSNSSFDSTFRAYKSSTSGIVTYYQDGFEDFDVSKLSPEVFDKTTYNKQTLKTGDIIASGSPVYKIIDSEKWQIAVKLTKDEFKKISDSEYVRFTINNSGKKLTEKYEAIEQDEDCYIVINMENYMAQYVNERYLDINFIFSETKGLKIPNSAIVEKDVYIVPIEFLTAGSGSSNEQFFNQRILTETGDISVKQISPIIYFTDERFCYVDPAGIDSDAVFIANDTNETFSLTTAATHKLEGVFCVTQGTARFKRINIMIAGDDYSIVEPDISYGISAYDRIVLIGNEVKENQVIY